MFGPPSPLLELPVLWYVDDFPVLALVPVNNAGLGSTEIRFQGWQDQFDFARTRVPGGVSILTVHSQTIGRAHHLMMLERLEEYISDYPAGWELGEYGVTAKVVAPGFIETDIVADMPDDLSGEFTSQPHSSELANLMILRRPSSSSRQRELHTSPASSFASTLG